MRQVFNWLAGRQPERRRVDKAPPPLTLADLEHALRAVEPAARLVPPRLLRRVIREHRALGGFGLRVPHSKSYVIPRQALLEIADAEELGGPGEVLAETVILLAQAQSDELAETPADELLLRCWRLLFHARVRVALEDRIAAGKLSAAEIRGRIFQLGIIEFDEIRTVLRQERFLLPPLVGQVGNLPDSRQVGNLPHSDDATVYVEFAAVYLELRHFAPELLAACFPALQSLDAVDQMLAEDVDAAQLLEATRALWEATPVADARGAGPTGRQESPPTDESANGHPPAEACTTKAAGPAEVGATKPVRRHRSERKYRTWTRRAAKAAAAGNVVGAAIAHARAELWAPREVAAEVRNALRDDIGRLVARLQAALGTSGEDPRPWHETLLALAHKTPRGFWTVEARMLYDLQKVCVDHERGVATVDVMEWLLSRGKRPIQRPLPTQREVLMTKHLRSAARRLAAVRLSERHRQQLASLLEVATQQAEQRLRDHFRPLVAGALDEVGLRPQNLPERVARKKIVEELLDQVVERGYLTLGDLRDAISRNNLKEPDCDGPRDFFGGDAVLQANRRLAVALDGVYHRGEFYLRWLQRFSSLAFGTKTGRFLTRYLAVPFGGAFLVLAFYEEMIKLLSGEHIDVTNFATIPTLGLFFFALFHLQWFRSNAWRAVKTIGRVVRFVFFDSVRWLIRLPAVQYLLHSRLAVYSFRFVLKPLVPTALLWYISPPAPRGWETVMSLGMVFLGLSVIINSRWGRNCEEIFGDWLIEGWHRFGVRILTGLFWFVVDVFRRLLRVIERLLYAVDEWLRFKAGESRFTLVLKGGLGVFWFFVAYVVRFAVNLLLEPQINPIKHFPVVTVSHKIVWTVFLAPLTSLLSLTMNPAVAGIVAAAILTCVPGIFGFLVWELKENWRLYAANRPQRLGPLPVGQHGETMARLLRPGFHSGTLPKRFAKLRRAQRKAGTEGSTAVRKHRDALRHIETALRRYVEREFLALFAESSQWPGPAPVLKEIHLASNRAEVAVCLPSDPDHLLRLRLETKAGWMLAGFPAASADGQLAPQARQLLTAALTGLDKTAGTDLVYEQIKAALPVPTPPYDFDAEGLLVWPTGPADVPARYDLRGESPTLTPEFINDRLGPSLPVLERQQLVFSDLELRWEQWVAIWEDRGARGARTK